ncbi:4Fe-4S binding protein [Caldicoprobacter faecalis]|uniref:dihydrouracil dehydrogenase (NAD(+)) n=1 Tax=Caldicoprobacter faecalis TaxID=937334 RepID=A0A1I5THF5_9FIRM|nr:4Fe-4S binding protein [Caldicoprobacter faecalis]SFP82512.1 dihydropyrimidine dehydrogenase (NAD+) subunit PreA [Caldicoprobacter faecalis]
MMLEFAGIKFKNPVVIASSPLTSKIKWLIEAEKHGAAAVSTKLTFIKQPFYGKLRMHNNIKLSSIVCYDRRLDLEEGLRLVEEAKKKTNLIIFSNITHDNEDMDGWALLAKEFENAGADIIEANMVCPNVGLSTKSIKGQEALGAGEFGGAVTGQDPQRVRNVIKTLKESVKIPVVAKLTPNVADIGYMVRVCQEAGADGVCLAGAQSSLPLVDIYNDGKPEYHLLNGVSHGSLGGPACLNMAFSQVAQAATKSSLPIIGGGGLETAEQCIMMMMWGATLVTMCTSVMWYGWEIVDRIVRGMEEYLEKQGVTYQDIIGKSLKYLRPSHQLEALEGWPEVDLDKCIGCGRCAKPGHCDAIEMVDDKPAITPDRCLGCGICIALCPTKALTMHYE